MNFLTGAGGQEWGRMPTRFPRPLGGAARPIPPVQFPAGQQAPPGQQFPAPLPAGVQRPVYDPTMQSMLRRGPASFKKGTRNVKRTGTYKLHKGERVTPAKTAKKLRNVPLSSLL